MVGSGDSGGSVGWSVVLAAGVAVACGGFPPTGGTEVELEHAGLGLPAEPALGRHSAASMGSVEAAAASIEWQALGPLDHLGPADLDDWLRTVGSAVAQLYGRFPVPRVRVLVVPTASGPGPPVFGVLHRGRIPTVRLYLPSGATREHLQADWVAVHELSHTALPYLRRSDAWLSEGIATYYQEVLRARAGIIRRDEAWRRLEAGFERGRADGTGRSLRSESAQMYQTHAFRRVYWAGAALAFLADVELRCQVGGGASLDALVEAASGVAPQGRPWTADALLEAMATSTGHDTLTRLAERHLDSADFPAVHALDGLARAQPCVAAILEPRPLATAPAVTGRSQGRRTTR